MVAQLRPVAEHAREQPEGEREEAELHIAHPDGDVGPFENLFEVDSGETGEDAGGEGGRKAEQPVLLDARGQFRLRVCQLHEDHPREEDHERRPLFLEEAAPQDEHREQGRGEDLELVGDLVGGGVQIRRRNIQQVVLEDVGERRHAHLECVERLADDGAVQRLQKGLYVLALLVEHEEQAGEEFDHLGHEHGRRREEHVTWPGARVAHADPEDRILQRQCHQTHIFHFRPGRTHSGKFTLSVCHIDIDVSLCQSMEIHPITGHKDSVGLLLRKMPINADPFWSMTNKL